MSPISLSEDDAKPVPANIKDLADEKASADDKRVAVTLETAIGLAQSGPIAFRRTRRGATPPPWNPPAKVRFEHPDHGALDVELGTGAIAKREAPGK